MKNFLKKLLLFVLMFLVVMYFIGSCTERPEEYTPAVENNTSVYTELTPDEYQKQMDEIVKRPPVTQTAFKSHILQAYASNLTGLLRNYWEDTAFFDLDNWEIGFNDIKGLFVKDNPAYPGKDSSEFEKPVESVTVPFQYDFYGKNRVVYGNGTYEIIECRLITSSSVGFTKKKTGHITYRRTNQYHSTTSFGFDISVLSLDSYFNSDEAFSLTYFGVESNISGLDSSFISSSSHGLKDTHWVRFQGSSVNRLKQFNVDSNTAVTVSQICYSQWSIYYPNSFSVSSTVTNDYEFSQSVNNYYINKSYWRFPNVYYDNHAGDIVTQNNVTNYSDYGYTYNNVTNSIEFDPNVFSGFLDNDIIPKFQLAFDDIFSHFPDIGAEFGDLDVKYTNIVDILNEINNPPATGTYPVATGDVNVNVSVDVTFPPEFYKTYPPLTTQPAFIAKNPDIDFALDSPLPVKALKVSGSFITLASEFIEDSGFMPIALMSISFGFIVMFFL